MVPPDSTNSSPEVEGTTIASDKYFVKKQDSQRAPDNGDEQSHTEDRELNWN